MSSVGTLAGFALGFALGRLVAQPVANWLAPAFEGGGAEVVPGAATSAPEWLAPLVPIAAGLIVAGIFGSLGTQVRGMLKRGSGAVLTDSVLGAVVGLVSFALVAWLGAAWVRTTPFMMLNQGVAQSRVIATVDRVIPGNPNVVLGSLDQALSGSGFPTVFQGQPENIRGIGQPNEDMVEVGKNAHDSVVRVVTGDTICSTRSVGSGWVYRDDLVVTNAHVVAGSTTRTVQVGGTGKPYDASLVAFDPDRDVAVLRVDGLDAPPLDTGPDLGRGADSVAVGFPENGPYTISPARVREELRARGLDIYNDATVVREVYSLRGIVREGNSGGPLLNSDGQAVGMVFAKSISDEETGYALTLGEIESVMRRGASADTPVQSGACAVTGG